MPGDLQKWAGQRTKIDRLSTTVLSRYCSLDSLQTFSNRNQYRINIVLIRPNSENGSLDFPFAITFCLFSGKIFKFCPNYSINPLYRLKAFGRFSWLLLNACLKIVSADMGFIIHFCI
jgi:hypothetical protein